MDRKELITIHGKPVTLTGTELKVGEKAPDFSVVDEESNEVKLGDFTGKVKLISVTPSLDTAVCDLQARRFNSLAAALPYDIAVLNISMDLPFAIKRFCTTANIDRVKALSDHRDASFGNAYGVLMKEARLLARSIFIIDKQDTLRYIEIVPEISSHPDYDKALLELEKVTGVKEEAA